MRWWRHRRCLRRIADLERELEIWPPWHFVVDWIYDDGPRYRLPTHSEIDDPPRWAR